MTSPALSYIDRVNRDIDRTEDNRLAKFIAIDLPCPGETAYFLATIDPISARLLLSAYEGPSGWRVSVSRGDEKYAADLRAAGLVEAAGTNPTPETIAKGKGYHLSAFGLKVRRHLKRLERL